MPVRRNRILFVDHVSKVLGGAEVNLLELLACPVAHQAWDLEVACASGSPLDEAVIPLKIPRHDHRFAPALNELRIVGRGLHWRAKFRGWVEVRRATQRLRGLIDQVRPDAVISCTNKDHFAAGAAAHALGIPSIWWVNDVLSADFFPWPVRRVFAARARRLARRLAPVSEYCRRALIREGIPAERCVTIPNGIPLERYRGIESDVTEPQARGQEPVIGIAGRITPWKGQKLFLQIASEWIRSGRPGRFVLLGRAFNEDAPFEASLRAFILEQGIGDRVQFLEFQSDMAAALRSMDVLLHCSTRPEPFGRVIIEAMAVGVPVIAARDGGVPEIITDGVDGLLVNSGDRSSYLQALDVVIPPSPRRSPLRISARRTVEQRFTVDRVASDFARLIDSVLTSNHR